LFFLGTRETLPHLERPNFSADVARPTNAEQEAAWTAELDDQTGGMPARLVSQFNLNLARIHHLGGLARAEGHDSNLPASQKTWAICRASERPRMDALAQRLEPKVTWDDLVLPAEQTCALKQIAAQVAHRHQVYHEWGFERKMNRGFGISVLFAGDSGTGKTMAAEVIANELELDLYRIDLSAVVNKYIGETEKNLRRVFDAAEEGGAILFFDEADALFGKRSEVKDSHDRYANVEINYLLQRIESYHGLAILATNMKSALDTAFLRRLRFVINFPYPTLADRRRLWEKVFLQAGAKNHLAAPPLDDLDYERLAKLNLAGGNIHNAALNAAFQAAAQGSNVTMPLVFEAIRTELRKLDRPINEADFDLESPGTQSRAKNGHLILR
jgi:SpoVK/Ycf46/Vps4 family AAA+-type ATPase